MNTFEVAVLRVLIKRQQPLKLSALVNGFPDDSEDNVLSAVSNLKLQGYLVIDDYQPNGYVLINKARRKEILQIVDSDIHSLRFESLDVAEKDDSSSSISTHGKKTPRQVTARHRIVPGIRTIAFSSLLIVGLVSAIGISLPTATSPDSEFVSHHEYTAHKKWSGVHRTDVHEGDKISSAPYPAMSASFVALKDCNQRPLHEQQT
ncbi:MAG: hypothetical protein M3251_02020 [Thermoproteota archaeon]|nr:hypothetical protein [Thermoproteota archaeon]